ncbi:MAG: transposase [Candidatus Kuenenia sp.]|nr:transposase [Candidatus Kuenenia sp.]
MKLTCKVKLITDIEQAKSLEDTIVTSNKTCNFISEQAWQNKIFGQYNLQKLLYHTIKKQFTLTAQVVIQCIVKVVDAYKLDNKTQRKFKLLGAITYDSRILSWKTEKQFVSIWTVDGRLKIPYVCGKRQKELLNFQQGETDLVLIDGKFYLHTTCNIETPEPKDFKDVIGVDRGIKNIATLSSGDNFTSNHLLSVRCRYRNIRKKLQKKGTVSAKRLLKKRNKKETRFATHTNHVISKAIVTKAKDTKSSIALEDLKGIRERTTVKKKQRATHHSWGFHQLAKFIEYKALLAGVPVVYIDPRNTSRECISCGYIDKANRKSQSLFSCVRCGHTANADQNAAMVIANRGRAALNQPYATSLTA